MVAEESLYCRGIFFERAISGRRRYDWHAMNGRERIRHDEKAASRFAPKGDDSHFDLYVAVNGRSGRRDLE
jgi:hypothetical protein